MRTVLSYTEKAVRRYMHHDDITISYEFHRIGPIWVVDRISDLAMWPGDRFIDHRKWIGIKTQKAMALYVAMRFDGLNVKWCG